MKGAKAVHRFAREKHAQKKLPQKVQEMASVIRDFKPSRSFLNEAPYARELTGYLRREYGESAIEEQKGSSRPDIVANHVAIEVKGPTRRRELETIASKLLRYSRNFPNIVVVLFEMDPRLKNSEYYQEWKQGIRKSHPDVEIVEK